MSNQWTWMIYLATHNSAAEVGDESLARMRAALGQVQPAGEPAVRVLAQQATPDRCVRRVLGSDPELVAELGPIDSGTPASLLEFVRWAAATAPARHYALVLWSHGSGWAPREVERLAAPAAVPLTAAELQQRGASDTAGQVFFSSSMRELAGRPTPADRAIAFDNGSGHSLDTLELGRVLAKAARELGRPLDLVGMNACQMSSAEVAYQLRGSAEVYVASAEDMPAYGWPYEDLLPRLAAAPGMDPAALGALAVERYCAYFRDNPLPWGRDGLPAGVTLAALRLDGVPTLARATGELAGALLAEIDTLAPAVWAAHRRARAFKFQQYDLAGFCRALAEHPAAGAAAEPARAVLAALASPALVLASEHLGPAYDGTAGLATYLLAPGGPALSPDYARTAYAQATGWDRFLAAYHAAVA